jgi:hypothetical protein
MRNQRTFRQFLFVVVLCHPRSAQSGAALPGVVARRRSGWFIVR